MKPSEYAKALVGAALAGLTAFSTALADGTVTGGEWVTIVVAVLATGGAVFGAPNAVPSTPGRRRNDAGNLNTALSVVALVVLTLLAVLLLSKIT